MTLGPRVKLQCKNCGIEYKKIVSQANRPFHNYACYRAYITSPDRFWENVSKSADGCWTHNGSPDKLGYVRIGSGTKRSTMLAHHRAWTLATGEKVPRDMLIGHICDNPPCVRNDGPERIYVVNNHTLRRRGHLFLGTVADNNNDKETKQRGNHPSGKDHGKAKLTRETIEQIRARYTTHEATQVELAATFGVTQGTISKVVRLATWNSRS